MKNYLTILLFGVVAAGYSQNYDADSMFYTPIEKPHAKKIKLVDEKEGSKMVEYFFNLQMGSLIGCNDCGKGKDVTSSFATTHGVTVGKKWRGGVGTGFDSYTNWHTIPLYAMASWDLIGNKNRNAVYLQLAYGWAHPWFIRNGEYNYYTSDPFNSIKGGRMINPSIGYRLKYHDLKLSVGVGYKFQRIFYKSDQPYYCGPACDFRGPSQNHEITQDFNRVQVMMSVGWK
jgi:hypothetical protein